MYVREAFTPEENAILSRFFTNTDRPVFAIVNLPEIVKGAMFARYSRTHKSLRRLFLDEFYEQPDIGIQSISDAATEIGDWKGSVARQRAEELYQRVFVQYGDDSVAQLGGSHLACEQVSAILAKIIERGRLAAYLEQSTRYLNYGEKLRGSDGESRYRYCIPSEIRDGPLFECYVRNLDSVFADYLYVVNRLTEYFQMKFPRKSGTNAGAHGRATRARAFDTARGLLPAATTSNIGIFATGQAYESMMMRMNAHPLEEARRYSGEMLCELRKVIAGFVSRVDVPDRGVAWSQYLEKTAASMNAVTDQVTPNSPARRIEVEADEVMLTDWDPDAEVRVVAAAMFPFSHHSETRLMSIARRMTVEERRQIIEKYVGDRSNRRHKPGRGMESIQYRFEIQSDFGSFRDLQRHRMMTIDWQKLSPLHGYWTPPEVFYTGGDIPDRWSNAMRKMEGFFWEVDTHHGSDVSQYVVPFGYRIRYNIQLNARQAFHMLELRTGESGHTDYRRICLEMHRLIRDQAGHRAIADAMSYVDSKDYGLGRLRSERRQSEGEQLDFDIS